MILGVHIFLCEMIIGFLASYPGLPRTRKNKRKISLVSISAEIINLDPLEMLIGFVVSTSL